MIKNARELSGEGISSLERLYSIYFRDDCVCHTKKLPRKLEETLRKTLRNRYTKEMMRRIESGESTCLVDCDSNDYVVSFITGSCDGTVGTLRHVRLSKVDPSLDRFRGLRLYRAFATEMKNQGAKRIVAPVEVEDKKLIDLLEMFGLKKDGELAGVDEYKYIGDVVSEDEQKHI